MCVCVVLMASEGLMNEIQVKTNTHKKVKQGNEEEKT
jgi:hypothetical protein